MWKIDRVGVRSKQAAESQEVHVMKTKIFLSLWVTPVMLLSVIGARADHADNVWAVLSAQPI